MDVSFIGTGKKGLYEVVPVPVPTKQDPSAFPTASYFYPEEGIAKER